MSSDTTPTESSSDVKTIASSTVLETQRVDQNSSSEPAQLSSDPDFDDSGYHSGDEEAFFQDQIIASKVAMTAASSSSAEYATPQTPPKATKPASTDSGISMSFDKTDESQIKQSIKYGDGSESPSARKASRGKPVKAGPPISRPAPTPIQPTSLPFRTKQNFVPFDDPFAKVRNYIKKPLSGDRDKEEGYIYGYQLDGCAYTKVGYGKIRPNNPSLDGSLGERMKEHKKPGQPDLKVVLRSRRQVPHAHRVEKIIHCHLAAGRMREQCSCKISSGLKCGTHRNYTEWFNNSLDEIYTVVIAWEHWILSKPYAESHDGRYYLSSEWKSRLENIRIRSDRDNWLEWLYEHVPGSTNKTSDTTEGIEDKCITQNHGSFTRYDATGTKKEIKRVNTCL